MEYTVKKLAKLAGISVRTLHYYDEIDLLKPSYIRDNGYRYYSEKELARLQQIMFFRELEFPLEKIKEIMDSPGFDPLAALSDQKNLLELKKKRLEGLIKTIDKTITSLEGGETMSDDKKYSGFNDPEYLKYKDEVEKKWGNTDAYKQSMDRVGKMTREDLSRVKKDGEDIRQRVGELMVKGLTPDSPQVQEQIGRFYKHLRNFYDPTPEMFKGLGNMYLTDPRFTKVYEDTAKGLATFMRDAMAYYSDSESKRK